MMNIHIFILILAALSVISCFNPFFPQTGTPQQVESSPERTIQLLKEAYERKDIYSFENLIYSQNDFSSYTQVSEDYSVGLTNFRFEPRVLIDSIFAAYGTYRFLPPNRYYFELNWEQERKIHGRMFDLSDNILFLRPFYASPDIQYEVLGDDTLSAMVKTQSSQMRVTYGGEDFVVDVTGQIFAMKRDGGVWKIWKWIKLN